MEVMWSYLSVYKLAIIEFVIGLALIILGSKTISKSESHDHSGPLLSGPLLVVLFGCALIICSIVTTFVVYRNQALDVNEVTDALSEGDCVSRTLRAVLSETDEPLSRNHLSAIRDTCEDQQVKALELAKKQRVLNQQRIVAEQHTSTISEED